MGDFSFRPLRYPSFGTRLSPQFSIDPTNRRKGRETHSNPMFKPGFSRTDCATEEHLMASGSFLSVHFSRLKAAVWTRERDTKKMKNP